jgi:hypothetical protein
LKGITQASASCQDISTCNGTPTKRQVSKRQVSKRLVSKRPVFKFDILVKQKV